MSHVSVSAASVPDPFSAIVSRVLSTRNVRFPQTDGFDPTPFCDDLRAAAEAGWSGKPTPVLDPEDYSGGEPDVAACADAYSLGVALRALVGPVAPPAPVPSEAENALTAMIAEIRDDGVPDADFTRFSDGAEALARAAEEGGVVIPLAAGGFAVAIISGGAFSGAL